MFLTILIAIFSIIALSVIHEFGHFIVAKRFGVKVEEFGIGYPPRVFGKKFGEIVYSVNLLPFGAFVKIHGEEGGIEGAHSLSGKPIWQRALIILGGVISFWIAGLILLSIVFSMGASVAISDEEEVFNPIVQIAAVAENSPAQLADLRMGDIIKQLTINPEQILPELYGAGNQQLTITKVKEVQKLTEQYKGQEITLTIERGKEVFEVSLIPRVSPPEGEGVMGVALVRTAEKSYPFFQAVILGIETTINLTQAIIVGLAEVLINLIKGQGLPSGVELGGPVKIGLWITQAAQIGLSYFLQFIAVISIYLAIFNLLPIPALDGGKLLFLGIEKIKGSPINQKIEQNITASFFFLLIMLMILITIKDIASFF